MPLNYQKKNQHLLWRAGFGPAVEQLDDLALFSPRDYYKALVKASGKKPEYINVADNYLTKLAMATPGSRKEMSPEERRMTLQKNREGVRNLNLAWLKQMINSGAQLREKMAFFWHGHFACRNLNVFFQQGLLDVIRQNALGNFGTLLKEVSKTPAMLNFLNNQQNRKDSPNENFAREVMELFTLGRGQYTENDVKEAARAFTGWGFNAKGEFVFRKFAHDAGSKTVLGKTGNFQGGDILDVLLDQQQTARFIAGKIYRYFVNDRPDPKRISGLADIFYKSNYDIAALMEAIFTSNWFYEEQHIGAKIKSPVELIVGIRRILPMTPANEDAFIVLQRTLGQMLFFPPNVAGWPGGKAWIDSSTLMLRMRLPQLINDQDELNVRPKDDDDQMMGKSDMDNPVASNTSPRTRVRGARLINANVDWSRYVGHFEKTGREQLLAALSGMLLQTPDGVKQDIIKDYADESNRKNFIRTATIQIMSTPEYQLC